MTDPLEKEPPPKTEPPKEVEVVKATFIEVFGDRFKSHSLGGFLIAWSVIHWKALYATVFVSMDDLPAYDDENDPILNKIDYFKSLRYDWCDNYVWPLLFALAVPIAAHFLDETFVKVVKQLISKLGRWLRQYFATEKLFTAQEMQEVEAQRNAARKGFEAEKKVREAAQEQIEGLRQRHDSRTTTLEKELADLELEYQDEINQKNAALGDLNTSKSELESVKSELGRSQEAVTFSEPRLKAMDEKVSGLKKDVADRDRQLDAERKRNMALQGQVAQLEESLGIRGDREHDLITLVKGHLDLMTKLLQEEPLDVHRLRQLSAEVSGSIDSTLDRRMDDLHRALRGGRHTQTND